MAGMQNQAESSRDDFRRHDPLRVENAEDLELAYRLQNAIPRDPELLKLLVDRYANVLCRWLAVLLYYRQEAAPAQQEILVLLQQVYTQAITFPDQFHGQASVLI